MRRFLSPVLICLILVGVVSLLAADPPDKRADADAPGPQPAPVPAEEAPERMTLPEGFTATLFAGEPDVVQPIAFTFDDRGRLWVVECYSYPDWHSPDEPGRDRVLIFEDTSGNGRFDRRTVFWDRGTNLSGIELGFGGVWLCATPYLLFLPDRDGDDRPDGPPEIVLDGWDLKAKHNVFNGLAWGPDGWLYGCNGILSNSKVGKPGTPDSQRTELNCGVWRYHPQHETFEVVAWGTTNPWGLDFDDYGEAFITNCVIEHLWHVIPGAHYKRMHGQDLNPHVYGLMEACSDHLHWGGGPWQESRGGDGEHSRAGGGHAHSGAMIYLGGHWPDEYRNSAFTCNIHGNRVNRDRLHREGSSYRASHEPDFLLANDQWFRGLAVKYGPDGSAFVSDWSDTGECHDYIDIHRDNGRIHKIAYRGVQPVLNLNLQQLGDARLVELQLQRNDWYVRHARRILHERAASGADMNEARHSLLLMFADHPDVTRKLRALWALHVIGGLSDEFLIEQLNHEHASIRRWAVRLLCEDRQPPDEALAKFAQLAAGDKSAAVRLALASALQRIPLSQRWPIVEALLNREEDAADPHLPLMIWYGTEPLVAADKGRALTLIAGSKIPLVRQYLAKRIAAN